MKKRICHLIILSPCRVEEFTVMRLVSFQIPTPMGPQTRTGALDAQGRVVDLAAAYRLKLLLDGLAERAAARISAALLRDFMGFESHLKNIYPRLGREIPPEWYNLPVYYKGNPGSLATHGDDIPMPSYAEELDFEFELAFVIGKGGTNIPRERAMEHVFGYTIYNDFSARAIQSREMSVGLGPAKGKDFTRGHVFGPWLVTANEIPDVYDLHMIVRVNGEVWCDSNSGTIHWQIADMFAHASLAEQLRPGELFGSGTVGNGSGAERGQMLKRGDVVELEVERLGVLRNRVV